MEEMSMEEQQQMVSFSNNDATHIAKGKRTKRLRLLSPCGAVMTTSSSSVSNGDESIDLQEEEEEEDMAYCLILLAQGGNKKQENVEKTEKATTTAAKVGLYVYECKTCNRTFPSFQALGGHRASHKKPKIIPEEKKPSPPPPPPPSTPPQTPQIQSVTKSEEFKEGSGPIISLQMVNHGQRVFNGNKAKIHECSICGSEFTSGQALGGHMRRHRASPTTNAAVAVVHDGGVRPPRNILQLDLNLPAPEEVDLRETKFQFMSTAPALVDCHY